MSLHCPIPLSQGIVVDDERDCVTVFGTQVSGLLFRTISEPTPPGMWFRVIRIENGAATIETKRD